MVVDTPSPPIVGHHPPQVFVVIKNVIRCTHCSSARVYNNGIHPPLVYFICRDCTDDDGNARTFKVPVA